MQSQLLSIQRDASPERGGLDRATLTQHSARRIRLRPGFAPRNDRLSASALFASPFRITWTL